MSRSSSDAFEDMAEMAALAAERARDGHFGAAVVFLREVRLLAEEAERHLQYEAKYKREALR